MVPRKGPCGVMVSEFTDILHSECVPVAGPSVCHPEEIPSVILSKSHLSPEHIPSVILSIFLLSS